MRHLLAHVESPRRPPREVCAIQPSLRSTLRARSTVARLRLVAFTRYLTEAYGWLLSPFHRLQIATPTLYAEAGRMDAEVKASIHSNFELRPRLTRPPTR